MTASTHPESPKRVYRHPWCSTHIDYEYSRQGVAEVYMICEPKAGKRFIEVKDNHNSQQWAEMIDKRRQNQIKKTIPKSLTLKEH